MTIAQRIGDLQTQRDAHGVRRDFLHVVRFMLLAGSPAQAEQMAREQRAPERVCAALGDMIYRAAVDPLSIGSIGATLSPSQQLAQGFAESLSNSAFDQMLGSMLQLPLRTRIVSATSMATGTSLAELDLKRVTSLVLAASDLEISKTVAQLALTREILVAGVDGGLRFLENELRTALAIATDAKFISLITAGATTIPSSGGNANGARLDIRALLQTINIGSASRLFLIVTPDIAAAWSVLGDSGGAQVFPGATYNGGTIGGIRVIASDGAPAQTITLVDASGVAAGSKEIRLDSSGIATIQLDSAPDSPPTASTNVLSLWQTNMVATRLERWFGAKTVRANSVAQITSANYTGGSPA